MTNTDKCDVCDKTADLLIYNISAKDQQVCEGHLPWIYNIDNLPSNVSRLPKLKVQEEVKDAGGKNPNKASTSSSKQNNLSTGTVSSGDTKPTASNS